MALTVQSLGVLCASGRAGLPADLPPAPALSDYKQVAVRPDRLPANDQTLQVGDWLGMNPLDLTAEFHAQHIQDSRETNPIYLEEKILDPGSIMRCCNWALSHNVTLPAWIHMGSKVRNLGLARVGDTLNVRARITKTYEHKGHKWVELDCLVVANETSPVVQAIHTAIYHPRQLAEAA